MKFNKENTFILNKTTDFIINKKRKKFNNYNLIQTQFNNGISSSSYIVYSRDTKDILFDRNSYKTYKVASLTKLMTLIIAIEYIEKMKINSKEYFIFVNNIAINVKGTTAKLRYGEYYSLYDLLYGMMLPSGNDASYLIAESIMKLYFKRKKIKKKLNYYNSFISVMNKKAKKLGLNNTKYFN